MLSGAPFTSISSVHPHSQALPLAAALGQGMVLGFGSRMVLGFRSGMVQGFRSGMVLGLGSGMLPGYPSGMLRAPAWPSLLWEWCQGCSHI